MSLEWGSVFVAEYFHFFTGCLTTLKLEYSKFYQEVEEEEDDAAEETLVADEDWRLWCIVSHNTHQGQDCKAGCYGQILMSGIQDHLLLALLSNWFMVVS